MVGELDLYLGGFFFSWKWENRNAGTRKCLTNISIAVVLRGRRRGLRQGRHRYLQHHTFHEAFVGGEESNKFVTRGLRNQAQLGRVKPRHDVGLSPVHSLGKVLQSFGLPTPYVRSGFRDASWVP